MVHLKARIAALVIILVFAGIMYYNWYLLLNEGRYYMKAAAFGPVGVIGGLFILVFPSMAGKPTTTKQKVIVLLVFAIGAALGLINWYLMDPRFFGGNPLR
jgi:hypothetical protein